MSIRYVIAALVALVVASCDRFSNDQPRFGAKVNTDSMGMTAFDVRTVAVRDVPELVESSGAAMSVRHAGAAYTINDSDNAPLLIGVDTTGAPRGVWPVAGATNVDWEAISIGPCPRSRNCIYIGDVGDNDRNLPFRVIYRLQEPAALGGRDSLSAESLAFTYADGAHDVEAMYVTPFGAVTLITKGRLSDADRKLRPALVYSIPASAWGKGGRAVATLTDSLPIVQGTGPLDFITDAALSPDRRHLAVRTYVQVYVFATDPLTGLVDHAIPPSVCSLSSTGESQGEGVAWMSSTGRLLLTTEGDHVKLHLATCPLP